MPFSDPSLRKKCAISEGAIPMIGEGRPLIRMVFNGYELNLQVHLPDLHKRFINLPVHREGRVFIL
jgi:hypothetical protein